jgi:peroxiredoxin
LGVKAQDCIPEKFKIGDVIPEFAYSDENGKLLSSKSFQGKTTLLVFFATWCGPCRQELPHVQKDIWAVYGAKANFKLLVIGREHSAEELLKFKKEQAFTFPIVADKERKIYSLFAKQYIPRTYLINKKGEILYQHIGFDIKEFSQLIQLIDKELKL